MNDRQTKQALIQENRQLRARLEELEDALRAARGGKVDDLVGDLSEMVAVAETKARLAQIIESSVDAIFSLSLDGVIESWNKAAERLFGYTAREAIGQPALPLLAPAEHVDEALGKFNVAKSGKSIGPMDTVRRRKDGSEIHVSVMAFPVLNSKDEIVGVSVNVRDISERKQAEERLKLFRTLLDQSTDSIEILDPATLRFIDANKEAYRALGYTREELLSMTVHDIDPVSTNSEEIWAQLNQSGAAQFESVHRRKDGSTFPVEVSTQLIQLDKTYMLSIVRDISERKRVEQALRASEQRLRAIVETEPECIKLVDSDGRLLEMNSAGLSMLEADSLKEAQQKRLADYIDPKFQEAFLSLHRRVMKGKSGILEFRIKGLKGTPRWLETHAVPMRNENGEVAFLLGVTRDITERKRVETELQHTTRALATLSEVNRSLVHATDEYELLRAICQTIVKQQGYRMAWVGNLEQDEAKTIRPVAKAGFEDGYLEAIGPIVWADAPGGQGPASRAARSGQTQIAQDIRESGILMDQQDEAIRRGYASIIALPLTLEGKVSGVLSIYAEQVDAFGPEVTGLLEEMAEDLTFGIRSLLTRQERDRALEQNQRQLTQLRDNLEDTIKAIATIVEMRDPYTAGHEARVAELAVAIAGEMGLPDEQVQGIRFAGELHDLGKIQLPAEILSKPAQLTEFEYELIKAHPQAGYEILKSINFPWPIAQMVRQHHERIDGSGYPQGLKGDEIMLEARILAVADVVEAMNAHRPYRPGLGLEASLEEIKNGRGVRYDPQVVDACLKLFQERNYKLPA